MRFDPIVWALKVPQTKFPLHNREIQANGHLRSLWVMPLITDFKAIQYEILSLQVFHSSLLTMLWVKGEMPFFTSKATILILGIVSGP